MESVYIFQIKATGFFFFFFSDSSWFLREREIKEHSKCSTKLGNTRGDIWEWERREVGLNAWNPASWEYTIHGFPSLPGKHGLAFGWWTPKASSDSKGTRLVYKTWEVQLCLPKARCLKSIFNLLKLHYHVAICSIRYMMSPQTIAQQESECRFHCWWIPTCIQRLCQRWPAILNEAEPPKTHQARPRSERTALVTVAGPRCWRPIRAL